MKTVQMEDGAMTSRQHTFPTTLIRVVIAAGLLVALAATGPEPTIQSLLAAEVVIDEPALAPPPQIRPSEEQTPQQSDQPKERKRTYDGPPRDELLPIARRLPA
jgi:hypothetical protein